MKKFFRHLLLASTVSSLSSCDCLQNVSGTILDKDTKQPIDSVYVHKDTKSYGEYSDKDGEFKLEAISGGLWDCPDMTVILSKEGYVQKKVKIGNAKHKKIYLAREI